MTEHVHEWTFYPLDDEMSEHFGCACGERMFMMRATWRVNATERLSAKDALSYCAVENHIWGFGIKEACDALKAYANILEGKDE